MNNEFILWQEYSRPVISISVTLFCFLFYHFITNSGRLYDKFKENYGTNKAQEFWVHFRQIIGFIFFGFIPFMVVLVILREELKVYGLGLSLSREIIYYTVILSVIIISINFFISRSPFNLKKYPLIKTKIWNVKLLILSLLGWIIYLLAYEFLFRGFLLFTCIQFFGIWPAIMINILIYSLVHLPQGLNETAGAIPFGLVLCFIVILSGTIWPAFFLHVILAISNEWFSIRNNREITLRLFSSVQRKIK
jgi:membrane protease YdiL (CAAX protease family)